MARVVNTHGSMKEMAPTYASAVAAEEESEQHDVNANGVATHKLNSAELEDFSGSSDEEHGDDATQKLDDAMMNELLLVCSNLGILRVQNEGEAPVLMRGEDCEEWIHDLQRAIRRDHAKHKLVAKQLGKWKILQKKLLPLLVNHQHDWSLVFSILKVLVMLTMKPTKDSTNIALQFKYLREYKHEFLRHGIIPILMTILIDPLSRKGSARTPQDYLNMELVLTLIRNLLVIPNEDPRFLTSTTAYLSHLQEDLICILHEENVYEMILLFAQDIDSAENREWNLLIMEMMDLTLGCSHPKSLVAFLKQRMAKMSGLQATGNASAGDTNGSRTTGGSTTQSNRNLTDNSLLDQLNSEKKFRQGASHRHSNFGGVMTMVGPTGRTTLMTNFSKTGDDQVPQAAKKPIARRRGAKQRGAPMTDISEVFGSKAKVTESDESTMNVLVEICDSILSKSYFQLTNSLKNEFRRGSSKLVSTDRLQYFHLVWFLTMYHRLKLQALKSQYRHDMKEYERLKARLQRDMDFETPPPSLPEKPIYDEKALLSTLDMFSFNFVLQSIENYASIKNYHGMTISVKLLAEMMAYLSELATSEDPRFQRIADSLQHKIFYERDFLDRLPVLLKTWSPGIFSTDYLVDVVTLTHLVFKVLDAQGNIKVLSRRKAFMEKKKKKKARDGDENMDDDSNDGSTDEEESERQAQLLLEMQRKESAFDSRKYFLSMLSTDTIKMYCVLLSNYRNNSAKVNHYIHSFFYRTKHFKIHQDEEWTMQPLLFNIHVLLLFNRMLQDTHIQRLPEFKSFLNFIHGVVREFFTLAEKNHLLLVEALFRQTYAAKSCLLLQRNYEPIESISKSRAEAVALSREQRITQINKARQQKIAMDAEELEGEQEFQFTLGPSDFQTSSLIVADKAQGYGARDFQDEEVTFDVGRTSNSTQPVVASKAPEKPKKSRAATDRAKNWSKVEDRYLQKVYMKYRHLPSAYEVISYEDMFQDRDRTPEQIERRVKFLKLHNKNYDSSDDEASAKEQNKNVDGEDEDYMNSSKLRQDETTEEISTTQVSARPRKRLRRVTDVSDASSESEDDILFEKPSMASVDISTSTKPTLGIEDDTSSTGIHSINMKKAKVMADHLGSESIESNGELSLRQQTEALLAELADTTQLSSTVSPKSSISMPSTNNEETCSLPSGEEQLAIGDRSTRPDDIQVLQSQEVTRVERYDDAEDTEMLDSSLETPQPSSKG